MKNEQTELQTDSSLACRYVNAQKLIDGGYDQILLFYIAVGGSSALMSWTTLQTKSDKSLIKPKLDKVDFSDKDWLETESDLKRFSDAFHKTNFHKAGVPIEGMGQIRWDLEHNVVAATFQSNEQAEIKENEKRQPVLWFSVGMPNQYEPSNLELARENNGS